MENPAIFYPKPQPLSNSKQALEGGTIDRKLLGNPMNFNIINNYLYNSISYFPLHSIPAIQGERAVGSGEKLTIKQ